MVRVLTGEEIPRIIRNVFSTDVDLYERRQHGDDKTLDGLVSYTMCSLFDGYGNVSVYSYGDEYGFIAVDDTMNVLRSFGIKKQHRDKKQLFWDSVQEILGGSFFACVWKENINATRFFEDFGGVKFNETTEEVAYQFNLM